MRPLEHFERNYLYDDWDEIVRSTRLADEVLSMPPRDGETDRARHRWAQLLKQGALFKRPRLVNWRVPPDASPLLPDCIGEIQQLGLWIDQLLQDVDREIGSNAFIREVLGFPACPEEELLRQAHGESPLPFFRLDLLYDPSQRIRLLEIQVVMGGLGITQALRNCYGSHPSLPGTAISYERAVLSAFKEWCKTHRMTHPKRPLVAVLGSKKSQYRHDHLILARHLRHLEMVVAPLNQLICTAQGPPTLSDGRRPHIIHRLFRSPNLFENNAEKALCLMECIQKKEIFVVNPWKDILEDKRILALMHDPRIMTECADWLSSEHWTHLQRFVPPTSLATADKITELLGRPRSERAFYLKKGRSYESRQLYDGQQLNLRKWESACLRARHEGDWIIQESVHGTPHPFEYLDFRVQRLRKMDGYVRLSPFFFKTPEDGLILGDVLITAREEHSRIHGASDAVLVVPGPAEEETSHSL
jgi:hypothetical protein